MQLGVSSDRVRRRLPCALGLVAPLALAGAACAREKSTTSNAPGPTPTPSMPTANACERPWSVRVEIVSDKRHVRYPLAPASVRMHVPSRCEVCGVACGDTPPAAVGHADPGRELLRLPRYPGVAFEHPEELCSFEAKGTKATLECITMAGDTRSKSIDLERLAHERQLPLARGRFDSRIVTRDMKRLRKEFHDNVESCPPDTGVQAIPMELAFHHRKDGLLGIRLQSSHLGFDRFASWTTPIGACVVGHAKDEDAICGGCQTGEGWSGVLVYSRGPSVFAFPVPIDLKTKTMRDVPEPANDLTARTGLAHIRLGCMKAAIFSAKLTQGTKLREVAKEPCALEGD